MYFTSYADEEDEDDTNDFTQPPPPPGVSVINSDEFASSKTPGDILKEMKFQFESEIFGNDSTKMDLASVEFKKRKEKSENAEVDRLIDGLDHQDFLDRVVASELRGKKFKVSNNGRCPKCGYRKNAFIILDFLFPMGDMPEICNYLITKGQAVLWSSQDDRNCKDPPTFICRGKCPTNPAKSGFNINWNKTDLVKIFFYPDEEPEPIHQAKVVEPKKSLVPPPKQLSKPAVEASKQPMSPILTVENSKAVSNLESNVSEDVEDGTPFDDGQIDLDYYKNQVSWVVLDEVIDPEEEDLDEAKLIKTMIALSDAKSDWKQGTAKLWPGFEPDSGDLNEEDTDYSGTDRSGYSTEEENNEQKPKPDLYALSWGSSAVDPWAPPGQSKKNQDIPPTSDVDKDTLGDKQGGSGMPNNVIVDKTDGASGVQAMPGSNVSTAEGSYLTYAVTGPTMDAVMSVGTPNTSTTETAITLVNTEEADPTASSMIDATVSSTTSKALTTSTLPAEAHTAASQIATDATTTDETNSAENEQKKYTTADFPVSKDGSCPYCRSAEVVYIVVSSESTNTKLPTILQKLLQFNFAYKMPRDDSELPSFQCLSCTYGFNLDWRHTNLDRIFMEKISKAENAKKSAPTTNTKMQPPPGKAPNIPLPNFGLNLPPMGFPPLSMRPPVGFPPSSMGPGFVPFPGFPALPVPGFGNLLPPPGFMPSGMPGFMPYHMPGYPMPPGFPMPGAAGFRPQMNNPWTSDGSYRQWSEKPYEKWTEESHNQGSVDQKQGQNTQKPIDQYTPKIDASNTSKGGEGREEIYSAKETPSQKEGHGEESETETSVSLMNEPTKTNINENTEADMVASEASVSSVSPEKPEGNSGILSGDTELRSAVLAEVLNNNDKAIEPLPPGVADLNSPSEPRVSTARSLIPVTKTPINSVMTAEELPSSEDRFVECLPESKRSKLEDVTVVKVKETVLYEVEETVLHEVEETVPVEVEVEETVPDEDEEAVPDDLEEAVPDDPEGEAENVKEESAASRGSKTSKVRGRGRGRGRDRGARGRKKTGS